MRRIEELKRMRVTKEMDPMSGWPPSERRSLIVVIAAAVLVLCLLLSLGTGNWEYILYGLVYVVIVVWVLMSVARREDKSLHLSFAWLRRWLARH